MTQMKMYSFLYGVMKRISTVRFAVIRNFQITTGCPKKDIILPKRAISITGSPRFIRIPMTGHPEIW